METKFSESPWHVMTFLRKLDKFGQPIPAFNLKGEDKVKTSLGGLLTAAIMTTVLGYAIMKMYDLIVGADPIIN